jgi:hypothetical protein
MWLLPALTSGDCRWQLPLCELSAGEIVLAWLEEHPEQQETRLAETLSRDIPLTVWVLCRGKPWRRTPPVDWRELAAWLREHAAEELVELVEPRWDGPEGESLRRRWANMARAAWPPVSPAGVFLQQAMIWLSTAGPTPTAATLCGGEGWFPSVTIPTASSKKNLPPSANWPMGRDMK